MLDTLYCGLLNTIKTSGTNSDDRTGVGTRAIFGTMLRTSLYNDTLPAILVRRVSPKIAFEELMFMLNGKTQTKELEDKNINIWRGNTTKEFQEKVGLSHLEEGDFGRMYGAQLRNFTGTKWNPNDDEWDYTGDNVDNFIQWFDQLEYVVNEIKNNPNSRRIISTHYNPAEASQGVLFPCHIMTQFNVRRGKYLDCLFWMRSSDVGFGLPYNLMYYGMLCHMMAKLTGYQPGELIYQAGDSHIYNNQIESGMIDYMTDNLTSVVSRQQPKFIINKELNTLEDMLSLTWKDISIEGYDPKPDFDNKPGMAV